MVPWLGVANSITKVISEHPIKKGKIIPLPVGADHGRVVWPSGRAGYAELGCRRQTAEGDIDDESNIKDIHDVVTIDIAPVVRACRAGIDGDTAATEGRIYNGRNIEHINYAVTRPGFTGQFIWIAMTCTEACQSQDGLILTRPSGARVAAKLFAGRHYERKIARYLGRDRNGYTFAWVTVQTQSR